MGKRLSAAGCVAVVIAIFLGFCAAELAIWLSGEYKPLPAATACQAVPVNTTTGAVTTLRFQKDIWSRWHWKYVGRDGINGEFQQRCPSITHDAELTLNGNVAGRTNGKLLTTISKTAVLDCHGDQAFEWDSGSAIQTFINSFQIDAKYLIRKQGTLVAYVDSTNFFSTDIVLRDALSTDRVDGNFPVVAELTRNKLSTSEWNWYLTIRNGSHPASDPLLLTMLAGQRSFSENSKSTDMCNEFFKTVGYLLIAVIVLVFVVIGGLTYVAFKSGAVTRALGHSCDCFRPRKSRYEDVGSGSNVLLVREDPGPTVA